ncbi:hypothetical protein C1645_792909 [Glomus cerebriforme]|uniref:Uncharacterized protein n=1 Tax=Glomus cerebriforme TaxID=658196 RepID=A0A397S8C8_9GLOM|nr:hypothetical protein C1645_792909 [Glomus cerebriforme]
MKLFLLTHLILDILILESFGQVDFGQDDNTASTPKTPPSSTVASDNSESPLLAREHPVLAQPLSNPIIVLLIFFIVFFMVLSACVYITKYKRQWFTRFSPIPTHPKNVDQHNLPIVEKSVKVLEENNNTTNTSFEDSFLDDTPMMTSKNSFSSTQLHPRSSSDQRYQNDETTSLVSNQPSTTSLPPSIEVK